VVVVVRAEDVGLLEGWLALLDLTQAHPTGWTLIGAQMVALHAAEQGRTGPRQSLDLDILVNARLLADGTEHVARSLLNLGFDLDGQDAFGVGHRFRRGRATIDVLAPDGLSDRTRIVTVAPARTISVPGGTQALARSEVVGVQIGERRGSIPRPSLLGAILIKARAVSVDDVPEAQRIDLAFLLALVENPRSLRAELRGKERTWLLERAELLDPAHPAWRAVDAAEVGQRALRVLTVDA